MELSKLAYEYLHGGESEEALKELTSRLKPEIEKAKDAAKKDMEGYAKQMSDLSSRIEKLQKSSDMIVGTPQQRLDMMNHIKEMRGQIKDLKVKHDASMYMSEAGPGANEGFEAVAWKRTIMPIITREAEAEEKRLSEVQEKEKEKVQKEQERKDNLASKKEERVQDESVKAHSALMEGLADMAGRVKVAEERKAPNAGDIRKAFEAIQQDAKALESGKSSVADIAAVKARLKELDAPLDATGKKESQGQTMESLKAAGPAAMISAAMNPKSPADIQERRGELLGNAMKSLQPWQQELVKTELLKSRAQTIGKDAFDARVGDIVDAAAKTNDPNLGRVLAYTPRSGWDSKVDRYGKVSKDKLPAMLAADFKASQARRDLENLIEETKTIDDPKKMLIAKHEIDARSRAVQALEAQSEGSTSWRNSRTALDAADASIKTMEARLNELKNVEKPYSKGVSPSLYDKSTGKDQKSPAYLKRVAEMSTLSGKLAAAKKDRAILSEKEQKARADLLAENPSLAEDPMMVAAMQKDAEAKASKDAESQHMKDNAAASLARGELNQKPSPDAGKAVEDIAKFKSIQVDTVKNLASKYGVDESVMAGVKDKVASGAMDMATALATIKSASGVVPNPHGAAVPASAQINNELNAAYDSLGKAKTQAEKDVILSKIEEIKDRKAEAGKTEMAALDQKPAIPDWVKKAQDAGMSSEQIQTLAQHGNDAERLNAEIADFSKAKGPQGWESRAANVGMSPDMIQSMREHSGDEARINNEISEFAISRQKQKEDLLKQQADLQNQMDNEQDPATKSTLQAQLQTIAASLQGLGVAA